MNDRYSFQIRLTGILIENNRILLVQQRLSSKRNWSLPGGRLEHGETIESGLKREMLEETGLLVEIDKLLYVCDVTQSKSPLIHMTFLLKRGGGKISLPTNEFDHNPIHDVRFVSIDDLADYNFSQKFVELAKEGFNCAGSYAGDKKNIGLNI